MRKLGIITEVNNLITISIWDEKNKKVVKKQINNGLNEEYKILSIVEYFSDTNTIISLTDDNLTKEEKIFLVNTLKEVMDDIKYQKLFLEELDILSPPKKK